MGTDTFFVAHHPYKKKINRFHKIFNLNTSRESGIKVADDALALPSNH